MTAHQQRVGPDHQPTLPNMHSSADSRSRMEPELTRQAELEEEMAKDTASMLTAAAFGPLGAFCFVAPCDCGRGLFARAPLGTGQFICEYGGPRLPLRLQVHGQYVLEVPGTSTVIDGASENSPFECPCSPAIYANHSKTPNARVETWPILKPGPFEVREHMVLVASEPIEAGREIRIDYEDGDCSYWRGQAPAETHWRRLRIRPPPPTADEPVHDRLPELQQAAARKKQLPAVPTAAVPTAAVDPIPWEGPRGGDARLHAIVPLLSVNGRDTNQRAWPLVSTHVPGRSGRECRERWLLVQHQEEHSGWIASSSYSGMSHAQIAAALIEANQKAAHLAAATALAAEQAECSSERCSIYGCTSQLVRCNGRKDVGEAVGCAESSHVICAPCLYRWFASQIELREANGLLPHRRKQCPICRSELRASGGAVRADSDRYVMGLLKVEGTW